MPLQFEKLTHLVHTLQGMIYRDPVPLTVWQVCDNLPYNTPMPPAGSTEWQEITALWGSRLSWAWLTTTVVIPDHFAGKPAALHMELTPQPDDPNAKLFSPPEAMVTVSGVDAPPQAINLIHHEIWLTENADPGQMLQIVLNCSTGICHPGGHQVRFKVAELVWIDRDVEGLYWDAQVLLDTVAALPPTAPERGIYLRTLDEAFQQINWLNPPDEAFQASIRAARNMLRARIFDAVDHSESGIVPRPVIHALGHAHIDVAWLWPLRVTRGKAARTFATALALMDQFPGYTFTQSQPHLYKMVAEDDPDMFQRIKSRIAEGRWNATGGSWVEPDTNMPSGESLVRQFLYGMRFFEQELGTRPQVLWLPDVFGYSGALPQIMQLAGIPYFFTSKLSWNKYTRYPYDTFWWEGLDGSRVLTHLATTPEAYARNENVIRATYNARMTPDEMIDTWAIYQQQDYNHHLAVAYGLGDGGGGPNRDMIERRARMEDLPGVPRVIHSTAEDFFHDLEATVPDDLPQWVGELYLQMHRGTFTSQARTKRHNRKTEVLLHNAEALASLAYLLGDSYPHDDINAAWEIVLLHQFHDILPGSSIRDVYEETERHYAEAQMRASGVISASLDTIAQHITNGPGYAIFNTLSTTQGGPVEIGLDTSAPVQIYDSDGQPVPFQWLDPDSGLALLLPASIPAYGYSVYTTRPADQPAHPSIDHAAAATPTSLENGILRADFDDQGNLIRLYDLEHGRDALEAGQIGNQLWAYVDRPHHWDAWEVEAYVQDQGWQLEPANCQVVESGPLRASLEVTYHFNHSTIRQRISLLAGQRTLIFDTNVDWHERHILLRTHFPLAIRAMNTTYEVQFGTVERPTHHNTAWDAARHEVPAQQWADLSEGGYGVSLLNDCKYGHSTQGNILTLSLLRAPTYPDPEADQGEHSFTYAVYPHPGDWRNGVIAAAKRLNTPLLAQPILSSAGDLPGQFGLVEYDTPGAVIDTLKKAEDGDALIVRVYESQGGRAAAALRFAAPIQAAEEVNLLEESRGPVEVTDNNTLRFTLTPYQIRSFRVTLAPLLG